MPNSRRSTVVPQLEVIHGSDGTVRAELIALPLVRTAMGDHLIEDPAAAAAVARADGSTASVPHAA